MTVSGGVQGRDLMVDHTGMDGGPDLPTRLDAVRAGDEAAITDVYRELHPRLARYLRAREPRAAEDLEAEVWTAFAERVHAFEGDERDLAAWMFAIARGRLADHRRTWARRATDPVPGDELDGPDPDEDPATVVVEGLTGDEAAAFVVRSLPRDQAEVVLLRVLGGLEVDQVAEILGKRAGTVRVLAHRGLRRLERLLTGEGVTR